MPHYGLQILKVSCDLRILDVNVVEIPWKYPDGILYPNVRYLLIFLATLPVSTASAERSFSQLSRIKSYCRSTMKQNRLNGLAAACIHKDLDINPDEILKLYTQMNSRRFDFGI